jgi:hypothetical protein
MPRSTTRRTGCAWRASAWRIRGRTSIEHGIPWEAAVAEMFTEQTFDGSKAKAFGIDFPSFRAFQPGELEPELDRLGFEVREIRGLAVLSRLMNPTNLKAVVSDEQLLSSFLDFEWSMATHYGRWAPSRELLFSIRRVC